MLIEIVISIVKGKENVRNTHRSQDTSIGTSMGYGLDGWVSIPGRDKRSFYSPQRQDRLSCPPILLLNLLRRLFPLG
jgi:hypothetical protein